MTTFSFLRNTTPLTDDQIRQVAPSVFADQAHESRSERYAYVATVELLNRLRASGFEPFAASQSRSRAERHEHTRHMLRLRHASARALTRGDSFAEISLVNSHDGSSAVQIAGAMFRVVCSNGMVASESTCPEVRVPHSGRAVERVEAGAFEVLDGLTRVIESRDAMAAVQLTVPEQLALANAAIPLRFNVEPGQSAPVTPHQVNQSRRWDDRGGDLWTTFNRIQENLVRGGLRGVSSDGSRRRTRAVTGIDQDIKLNRSL